jgi:hemolysin D
MKFADTADEIAFAAGGRRHARRAVPVLLIAAVCLAALLLFLPDEAQIMAARRLGFRQLGEVTGPAIWAWLSALLPQALRAPGELVLQALQGARLWQLALALIALVGLIRWSLRSKGSMGRVPKSGATAPSATPASQPEVAASTAAPVDVGSSRRGAEELAFLPAALEIVETPPSPTGRAIGASIMLLFCVALLWAILGRIDIVASAPGKIIPTGRTKIVQPFEIGVVRAIDVRDGQHVKAGDMLIELDATMNAAERDHLKSDLVATELESARLRAALRDGADPLADFEPPSGASPSLVTMHRDYLLAQVTEQRAKLKALDRQKAQKEAEVATILATMQKLELTIPLIEQRVKVRQTLQDFDTKLNYLETLQQLTEHQEDLKVQTAHLAEARAAVATLIEAHVQTIEEYRRARFGELAEAERKAAGLREDLVKAEQRTKLQVLTAPVDGVVQQLAVHTLGGVVTPAQALLSVVPEDSHLEIEAMVSNRDIGFVRAGQSAEIKVDTFNFTRFGLIHGQVLTVSSDAITREQGQDKTRDRQGVDASSEPKGQELVYAARISLDRTEMQIDDKRVPLAPGMAVTVEINTGSRRLISYLLSPLTKYGHESLRER